LRRAIICCAIRVCLNGLPVSAQTSDDVAEGIRQGILRDLSKSGMDVGSMDVKIESVSVRNAETIALASFSSKGGTGSLKLMYTMERLGDGWHIKRPPGKTEEAAYRELEDEDGIKFKVRERSILATPGGRSFGLTGFGLVDSKGRFIELELADRTAVDGVIVTKEFGKIILKSMNPDVYMATETQIGKMHAYLSARSGK